jgi:hypothetical protein
MTDPYLPPGHDPGDEIKPRKAGNAAPLIGCGLGGCLLPILLFLACAIAGDTGGPLFWPIIAVPLGIMGLISGFQYRARRR